MASHFHPLEVKSIRQETADCMVVSFIIPTHLKTTFTHIQGQNITLKTTIDGEELRRSYSICSSPLEEELKIGIKKIAGGKFSAWAATQLQAGAVVDVLPPAGTFYTTLNAAHKKKYMGFAAGSGITPLLSIIKTTLLTEPGSHFILVYGNKDRSSIIFREELEALKNKFIDRFSIHYLLSREASETPLNHGRIDAAKCELIFRHVADIKACDEFFLCGPEPMIHAVNGFLQEKGVEKNRIHFELFTVPGKASAQAIQRTTEIPDFPDEKISAVTIKLDGISLGFPLAYQGDSILDAALAAGADVPYACKGGVCASCRAKLLAGEVHMDNNYALEPEEIERGYILTCQSHPRTERVSIDFDAR